MKKFLASSFAALLIMLVLPLSAAFAASSPAQGQKNYCVEQILPLQAGQVSSTVVSSACFATFSQSIAFATNGTVQLSTAVTPKDLTAAQMKNASREGHLTTTTIGVLYENFSYGGGALTVTTDISNPTCNSSYDYGLSPMSPSTWDNVVSSLKVSVGGTGCVYTRLYADAGYSGANQCYNGDTSNVGTIMNDQTSSVRWSLTNPC